MLPPVAVPVSLPQLHPAHSALALLPAEPPVADGGEVPVGHLRRPLGVPRVLPEVVLQVLGRFLPRRSAPVCRRQSLRHTPCPRQGALSGGPASGPVPEGHQRRRPCRRTPFFSAARKDRRRTQERPTREWMLPPAPRDTPPVPGAPSVTILLYSEALCLSCSGSGLLEAWKYNR